MKTTTSPLNVASDISETITLYADDRNFSSTTALINEFGEVAFECEIELQHDYYPGDRNTGESYEFDVTEVDVNVIKVYDEDGEEIGITAHEKRQIEKLFENNLSFTISKKY